MFGADYPLFRLRTVGVGLARARLRRGHSGRAFPSQRRALAGDRIGSRLDLALKGKVAVVGGASQGIGFGIARLLAAEGASVAMVARREERLAAAATQIHEATGADAFAIAADIRKGPDCERIIQRALEHFGRIDILVNNDGAPPLGELASFDDAAWARAVEQNLMSVVRLSRGALPSMRERRWGRVDQHHRIVGACAASALRTFSRNVGRRHRLRQNTVARDRERKHHRAHGSCPGRIVTPRLGAVFGYGRPGEIDAAQRAAMIDEIPMKRLGTLDDCAGLVAFLSSPWAIT